MRRRGEGPRSEGAGAVRGWDLAATALPHRPNVALERLEVAQRRWVQRLRPEHHVGWARERLTRRVLTWINRGSGAALVVFGLIALLSGRL